MAETETIIVLGLVFLIGLAAELVGRRTSVPRVSLLVLAGVALGPSLLGLVDPAGTTWSEIVSQVALVMVGFLLGGHLHRDRLMRHGRQVFSISLWVVAASIALVTVGVWIATGDLVLALLLGGLATATEPAATADVVRESHGKGPFTDTLLGVVAVDDAWGIVAFSFLMSAAALAAGGDGLASLADGAWEVGGAILLGIALGVPLAYATGRISPGDPTLVEALGAVLLCLGAARYLGVSFLLAAVVLGAVVANLARHHGRPFHAIEGVDWPLMVVFFVLAGATLDVTAIAGVYVVGAAYVLMRVAGRLVGGWVGAQGLPSRGRIWIGLALLPQAGVTIGMALVAIQRFPDRASVILPVVLTSTVLFELVGPLVTRLAVARAGEARSGAR